MAALLWLFALLSAVNRPMKAFANPASADPPLLPRAILLGNPEVTNVSLSPDGQSVAYMAPHNERMGIWIRDLRKDLNAKLLTPDIDKNLYLVGWSPNGNYLIATRDNNGDENNVLYRVDPRKGDVAPITPAEGVKALVLGGDHRSGNEIVIGLNDRDRRYFDSYVVDLKTLKTRLLAKNETEETIYPTWIDNKWDQVFRRGVRADGGHTWEIRLPETVKWQKFLEADFEESTLGSKSIIGFDKSWNYLYGVMSDKDSEFLSLVRWKRDDLVECHPQCPYEVIHKAGAGTVAVELVDPVDQQIQVLSETDVVERKVFLDKEIKNDYLLLGEKIGQRDFSVVDTDLNSDIWMVYVHSDIVSPEYWIWDRKAKQAQHLFTVVPQLNEYQLTPMEPIEIMARDGLRLPSYLTRSAISSTEHKPLVLLVHGGPQDRDYWGLDTMHQFLSNRGYNVLSVNFRGSTGISKKHLLAGQGEWYAKMQDDLIDAVDWAISSGIADPEKVAIVGSSYGGYAALAGLTRDPERFAAGISIVGPSNVETLIGSIPPYWEPMRKPLERMIGVGSIDLKTISPLTYSDNIKAPLFVAHGANDVRVNISESEAIVDSLAKRGVPVEFVVFPDEGHGIVNPSNSIALYGLIEQFLAKHLGGRYEPLGSIVRDSSAEIRVNTSHVLP